MASGRPGLLARDCVRTLVGWPAPTPEQDTLRLHYVDHLTRHPDGWARACPGVHLTASALVCAAAERQVLLTLHARIGRWLQTGGHLEDDDASLAAAALREAAEESGLDHLQLQPVPLLLSRHQLSCGGRSTVHLDVQFLVLAPGPLTPVVGAESLDVSWFPVTALPEVDNSVRDLVSAAAVRLGWS